MQSGGIKPHSTLRYHTHHSSDHTHLQYPRPQPPTPGHTSFISHKSPFLKAAGHSTVSMAFHGMAEVNPGEVTVTPPHWKPSSPAAKVTSVSLYVQGGSNWRGRIVVCATHDTTLPLQAIMLRLGWSYVGFKHVHPNTLQRCTRVHTSRHTYSSHGME